MTKRKIGEIIFGILHGDKKFPTDATIAVKLGFVEELTKKHKRDDLQAILENGLSPISTNEYALRHWIEKGTIAMLWTEAGWMSNVKDEDIKYMGYLEAWEARDDMRSRYPDEIQIEIIMMRGYMDLGEAV